MRPLRALFSSPAAEKILHERATFVFEHARSHFNPMIQEIRVANPEATVNCAGAFVTRAVNQTPDARLNQRPCAHRARFNRRINSDTRQTVIAEFMCGLAQRDDFSVSSGIAVGASTITRDGDELVIVDKTSPDRHLTAMFSFPGRGQRLPHPVFIDGFRGSFH